MASEKEGVVRRAFAPRNSWWLIGALVALGTIIRLPQLTHLLNEAYSFRQTQTAFVVREYALHGINLFQTPLPVFGPNSDVPLEFPLWQAIAALPAMFGVPVDMSVRMLGLLCFQASALLLAVLVMRWHGRAAAIVAVALFEFLPFGLLWGASSLIDFGSVALALLMVVGLDRWLNGGRVRWLVIGGVAAILGFLIKVTSIPSWGLLLVVSVVLLVRERGWAASWRRTLIALIGPVVGLLAAVGWTVFADGIKKATPITNFLASSELRDWNFGSLHQRIDAAGYLTILNRISQEIAGPLLAGLLLAVAAAIFQNRFSDRMHTLGWLVVTVAGPLIFFNLYVVHSYYLIAIYPAIVAAMAVGGVWLFRLLPVETWQKVTLATLATVALFAGTALSPGGHADLAQWASRNAAPGVSTLIRDQTPPDAQIVMIGCDWDPTFLYYSERVGVMFRDADAGSYWDLNSIDDYDYLFNCRPDDLDAEDFVPPGTELEKTANGGLYLIQH